MCNSPHESVKYDLSFQYVVQMMSQVIGVAGSNPVWGYHIPSDRKFSSNFDFWVKVMIQMKSLNYVKSLKKIKYWQRNGSFKFWLEVMINMYVALFSQFNFFTWRGQCQELKVIGNLSDCPQILTVGRLTRKQQKCVWKFFLSKDFFNESDFCTNTLHYLILFQKRSLTFHCNWVWQNTYTFH